MAVLHFQVKSSSTGASDMKCLVASLVAALNASAHPLATEVACQLPTSLRHFLNVHNGFHEGVISERNFWNPHSAQKMGPF
jgi:hypothetical protein